MMSLHLQRNVALLPKLGSRTFFFDLTHKETFLIDQEETKHVKKTEAQFLVSLIADHLWAPKCPKYPPLDKIVSQLKVLI